MWLRSFFYFNPTVASLEEIKGVYVLTEAGAEPLLEGGIVEVDYVTNLYAAAKLGYEDNQTLKYDKAVTAALVKGETNEDGYTGYTVKVPAKAEGTTWAAILVIDANGNYAISNPWWISK